MELLNEIPSLDLADFQSNDPVRKKQFVEDLGQAFHTIGFVALKGHGLTNNFTKDLYQSVEEFFQSSDAIKQKYEIPGIGQRKRNR
jgi:isopenicillin N synthase-like dioxygenase